MLKPAIAVQNSEPRTGRNYHLDAIRGIAALVVVFDHLHQAFFVPYRSAATGPLRLLYLEHYFAGSAVMIFFALSGYLVGGSALRAMGKNRWSWGSYLLNRATRLYVALIPALILTAVLDHFGRIHGGLSLGYGPNSMKDFWGSLFFLQEIYTKPYGSDGPLWSLSYEFWFYLLFPLIALLVKRHSRRSLLDIAVLIAVGFFVHGSILLLFPCWLLGVAAFLLADRYPHPARALRMAAVAASVVLIPLSVLLEGTHKVTVIRNQFYLDSISAIPLLWAAITSPPPKSRIYRAFAIFVSEISFTLYLTHAPFLSLLNVLWLRGQRWPNDLSHLLLASIPFALSVLFGYGMYWLFESRTETIRDFIKRRFSRTRVESVAAV
jgi:peptidoglycan/LPS O-acetylase OafA/YrhL